jgi:hypothetical protein
MPMLPPTLVTLTELAAYDSVADVLAAVRSVRPRLPEARVTGEGVFLFLPEDVG